MNNTEQQYLDLMSRIISTGIDVFNERTGKICRTIINADMEYEKFPIITTRKSYYKAAIAEILGYLRGYSSAKQFREIGCNTWNANANENLAWLNNPHRIGEDDMGLAYRFRGQHFGVYNNITGIMDTVFVDQYKNIIDKLSKGIDDRGLIMSAWYPHLEDYACLRPCMYSHTFSLLDNTLYLTSNQRSVDFALGCNFNMIQCYVLLHLTAQITGYKAGKVFHKMVNVHLYEDHIELAKKQLERTPFEEPVLLINEDIKSLKDLETWVTTDDFNLIGYQHHEPIFYPFSV